MEEWLTGQYVACTGLAARFRVNAGCTGRVRGAYAVLWASFDFGPLLDCRILCFECLLNLGHFKALSTIELGHLRRW